MNRTSKKEWFAMLATKLIKRICDTNNAKEYYKLFLRKNPEKLVKRSKVVAQQPKTTESSTLLT